MIINVRNSEYVIKLQFSFVDGMKYKPGLVRWTDHCVVEESLLKCLVGSVTLGPDPDYVGRPITQPKLRIKLKF